MRNITNKNYHYKIKQFIRQYKPNTKKLNFLVTDSKNVIHYFKNNNFHIDK